MAPAMAKTVLVCEAQVPFVHGGITYNLSHLDEYHFTVVDSDAQERRVAVTFSDHCFTRAPKPNDVEIVKALVVDVVCLGLQRHDHRSTCPSSRLIACR